MFQTILFDLDDTLLGNSSESFVPHYFDALGNYFADSVGKELFLQGVMTAVQAMTVNRETAVSNYDIFWQSMQDVIGYDHAGLEDEILAFYRDIFPTLQPYTHPIPVTIPLMRYCFARGFKVVIATNPLYPQLAIEERLRWAGVPVTAFNYARVTVFENSTAVKPNPAYYQQILQEIDSKPADTLMVGNDWEQDIQPTAGQGIAAYWINDGKTAPPDPNLIVGHGTLDDFFAYIQQL